jgi:hypothetical protein
MAIGVLGIAQGAAKVAGKLFGAVKKARDKKVAKAAQRLVDAQGRANQVNTLFSTPGIVQQGEPIGSVKRPNFISSLGSLIDKSGTQTVTSAANNLSDMKAGAVIPVAGSDFYTEQNQTQNKGFDPKWIMIGVGALLLFPILKKVLR